MDSIKLTTRLALALGCCLLSACGESSYERKLQQAKIVTDPWERFGVLSADVDPNAWARAWPGETDDRAEWAAATYLALQEAIRKNDPRAFDYVSKGAYGEYASLQELRAGTPAQADLLERLKGECDKAGIALSREFLASATRGGAEVKMSACSDKVRANGEAAYRERILAQAKSEGAK